MTLPLSPSDRCEQEKAALRSRVEELRDAALRLGVHATGVHVTPVDTDALGDLLALTTTDQEGALRQ